MPGFLALGARSDSWMPLLGAVMAADENLPWGRRLSMPLGFTLLTGASACWRGVLA